jgi:hypothetical protein
LGDLDVGGKIILKHIKEMGFEDVDCIYLAQDRTQWRVSVNTMSPRIPEKEGNSLSSYQVLIKDSAQ